MLSIEHPADARAAERLAAGAGIGDCAFVAGGTALQLGWPAQVPALRLIDVRRLPEAQGIGIVDGQVRIGAAQRLEALRRDPAVAQCAPLLVQACATLAALSVRHLGTLGGNVGWGFGDCIPALLAMDAQAELADGREVALDALLRATPVPPLMVAFRIDAHRFALGHAAGQVGVLEKVGLRAAFSPARLTLALTARLTPARELAALRIAAGAAGVRARRLGALEQQLEGMPPAPLTPAMLRDACRADLPDSAVAAELAARLVAGHLGSLAP